MTRQEPELQSPHLGSTISPQIRQFRSLLQQISTIQREQPTSDATSEAQVKAASLARDQLVQVIAAQELEIAAVAASDELSTLEETRYLKAALADELLLHSVWLGQAAQLDFLLEDQLFHTRHSGQEVFVRIDRLLRDPSERAAYLSSVYLFVINAGFQGQYRGDPFAGDRLQEIAGQLFRRAYRRPAEALSRAIHATGHVDRRICHQAYENVLSGLAPIKVFRFTKGMVLFIGLFLALGLSSQLIWLSISGPVRQALEDTGVPNSNSVQTSQKGPEQTR
ncbi:MAG: DotU family type IV/VI secretion system protein [Burkholderiaceae bacterium]